MTVNIETLPGEDIEKIKRDALSKAASARYYCGDARELFGFMPMNFKGARINWNGLSEESSGVKDVQINWPELPNMEE